MLNLKAWLRSKTLQKTLQTVRFRIELNNLKARVDACYKECKIIPFDVREKQRNK